MNNTFDINRLGLLIRKQWLEYGKLYLIILAIVTGIIVAVYSFAYWRLTTTTTSFDPVDFQLLELRASVFMLGYFIFLTLAANNYFAPLGQKPKAILELTIPASNLEKFTSGILYGCVFALASYCLVFSLVDLVFVTKLRSIFPTIKAVDIYQPESQRVIPYFFNSMDTDKKGIFFFIATPFLLTSVFILGSLFFQKFQYIKTLVTAMVFSTILGITISKISNLIFEDKIRTTNNEIFSDTFVNWAGSAIFLLLTFIIWIIAYTRFKEKEV